MSTVHSESLHSLDKEVMRLTWSKYLILSKVIDELKVKDRRLIFNIMRTCEVTDATFFPSYGFTAGEFSIWHILSEPRRGTKRSFKGTS